MNCVSLETALPTAMRASTIADRSADSGNAASSAAVMSGV
jgi:hypothetical protein